MNKIILKNSIKEIKNNFRRFLSLLLIAMLGVGFFAGLKATSPDMKKTIDTFFDNENLFDIKVVSTMGLTKDDVEEIKKIENVDKVYGSYSEDVFINIGEKDKVVKVLELNENINNVKLIEGSFPKSKDECVIENAISDLKIGDYIEIKEDLGEDEESSFYNTKLKVVGKVDSPLYISTDKGTSTLGSGKLENYIFVPSENINSDIFTEIYVMAKNSKSLDTTTDEYSNYIDDVISNIDKIKNNRQKARYDSIIDDANTELADAEKEFADKKKEGEEEILDAEKKISDAEKKLIDGERELASKKAETASAINDAENSLRNAETQLSNGKAELSAKKQEAEKQFAEAEKQKEELKLELDKVVLGLEELEAKENSIKERLSDPLISNEEKLTMQYTLDAIQKNIEEAKSANIQLTGAIKMIDEKLTSGKTELAKAENQISTAEAQINSGKAELNSKREEANTEFSKAEKELADAKKEIEDGKVELADAKNEFNEEIAKAEEKLIDAREKINDIENPKWYIFDRSSNNGYDAYINDTENIARLANAFPIIFFVIAILISLTSMSRMVEEQRIELGTLKALGYKNSQIILKYVMYAFFATVIGSIFGMCIGFKLIPSIILKMYQLMYPGVKSSIIEFNTKYAVLGLGIMLICTLGATIYSSYKELASMPAKLMRPKPPKKRKACIFRKNTFYLGKIKLYWKSYSKKYV